MTATRACCRRSARKVTLQREPRARPEQWRVEEIDGDEDGSCFVAIFSGYKAEERARRFKHRLESHTE